MNKPSNNKHVFTIILIYLLTNALLCDELLNCMVYDETIFNHLLANYI